VNDNEAVAIKHFSTKDCPSRRLQIDSGRTDLMLSANVSSEFNVAAEVNLKLRTAEYIAELCGELTGMANKAQLSTLSYFLAMARLEAEDHADAAATDSDTD
jgi:hypothetical protein